MAPRMAVMEVKQKETDATTTSVSRASSQAEAVAAQTVAAAEASLQHDDATAASTPPATPPRAPKPVAVRQESALKRLQQRLRFRGRRSLSAPPALRNRNRNSRPARLLEEHFRVDRPSTAEAPVVLPGVPKHEDNWDRDLHDFFNLVILVPVVALNMMNWNWDLLLHHSLELFWNNDLTKAWTGEYFEAFFFMTAIYFTADLVWIMVVPTCVRSPGVIVQHHVSTLLYISVPYYVPLSRWMMGACMSVEINTWLLIARRVFNKQGFPPWIIDLSFFSFRVKLISIFFYVTWIAIRCLLYPYLLMDIWKMYETYTIMQQSRFNLLLVCFPLHAVFCLLNLKWSYDLLMSKIRYWRRRGTYSNSAEEEDSAKDKGL